MTTKINKLTAASRKRVEKRILATMSWLYHGIHESYAAATYAASEGDNAAEAAYEQQAAIFAAEYTELEAQLKP